jgi:hypothetical protein
VEREVLEDILSGPNQDDDGDFDSEADSTLRQYGVFGTRLAASILALLGSSATADIPGILLNSFGIANDEGISTRVRAFVHYLTNGTGSIPLIPWLVPPTLPAPNVSISAIKEGIGNLDIQKPSLEGINGIASHVQGSIPSLGSVGEHVHNTASHVQETVANSAVVQNFQQHAGLGGSGNGAGANANEVPSHVQMTQEQQGQIASGPELQSGQAQSQIPSGANFLASGAGNMGNQEQQLQQQYISQASPIQTLNHNANVNSLQQHPPQQQFYQPGFGPGQGSYNRPIWPPGHHPPPHGNWAQHPPPHREDNDHDNDHDEDGDDDHEK